MTKTGKRIRLAAAGLATATALVAAGGTAIAATDTQHTARTVAVETSNKSRTVAQIRAQFDGWNKALATLDPNKVADRYARDAVLLPTVSNQVRDTRAEIVDYFKKFLAGKPQGTILQSHVKLLGRNAAIDTGTYRFTMADGSTVDARYTYVYERVNGKWLIVNHHSSAMPES
jgi:uncharacterized protein (TIGR02246 family)